MLFLLLLFYFECKYVVTSTINNVVANIQVQRLTLMIVETFIIVPFPLTNVIHVSWFSPYYATPVWVLVITDVVYL
jgi:hypothetical protein